MNSIVTDAIFGNKISLRNIAGIITSAAFNSVLPDYKAVEGSDLKNMINEMGNNIFNGFLTGMVQGITQVSLGDTPSALPQHMLTGIVSSFVRTAFVDATLGAPVKIKMEGIKDGLFRRGGLFALITSNDRYGGGITLGRNMWIHDNYPENEKWKNDRLIYHEYCHLEQQKLNGGWTGFYSTYIYQAIRAKILDYSPYTTEGNFDYDADQYYKIYYNNK